MARDNVAHFRDMSILLSLLSRARVSARAVSHVRATRRQPRLLSANSIYHCSNVGRVLYYTVLLMTAGGPSVGEPCSGWGQAIAVVTCLTGVVILALTVTVVETKLMLSKKAHAALNWQATTSYTENERDAAARYIQRLWRLEHAVRMDPRLEYKRMWRRRRAITRSVVSVSLATSRRRRVLAELDWAPTAKLASVGYGSANMNSVASETGQGAGAGRAPVGHDLQNVLDTLNQARRLVIVLHSSPA